MQFLVRFSFITRFLLTGNEKVYNCFTFLALTAIFIDDRMENKNFLYQIMGLFLLNGENSERSEKNGLI